MNEHLETKKGFPRWCRILLVLIVAVVLVIVSVMSANYFIGKRLSLEITKVSQAGEPLIFSDLESEFKPSISGQDASIYYQGPLLSISPDNLDGLQQFNSIYRRGVASLPDQQFPEDLHKKARRVLGVFQPALETFDTGAGLELHQFDIGIKHGIKVYRSHIQNIESAVLLLSLRTLNLILNNDGDAAVNSAISTLKLTRIFKTDPAILPYIAKMEYVTLVCNDIYLLLEHTKPSEQSLLKLQKAVSEAIPENSLERMFFTERVYRLKAVKNIIPKQTVARLIDDDLPDFPEQIPVPRSILTLMRLRKDTTQFLSNTSVLIPACRKPWPAILDVVEEHMSQSGGKPDILFQRAKLSSTITARSLVAVRCSILNIAIERYRRSLGKLPASLDSLSPYYVKSIPIDPFSGKALLYALDSESYVTYSVGPNRKDDGGAVEFRPEQKDSLDIGIRLGSSGSK
ncbi:MAG: hypothetical protein FVQ80_05490 [Planctomycetes bacterium]|nr:hypothetical protein [Planctomycetota bacterium]